MRHTKPAIPERPPPSSSPALNIDWDEAATVVDEFIELIDQYRATDSEIIHQGLHPRLTRLTPLMEELSAAIDPGHEPEGRFDGSTSPILFAGVHSPHLWGSAKGAANRLKGIIENRQRRERMFIPGGPMLSATGLHPWVWDAAKHLWNDGHFQSAVFEAAKAVELQTQHRPRSRVGLEGRNLYAEMFSIKDPTSSTPRLRFRQYDREEDKATWISAHEGAKFFGMGCAMRIRNLLAHPNVGGGGMDEQEALERLAALSLLSRWVEEAEVVTQT